MFSKLRNSLKNLGKRTLNESNMEKTFEELEMTLIRNDVAVDVASEICEITKRNIVGEKVGIFSLKKSLLDALRVAIQEILSMDDISFSLLDRIQEKKKTNQPYVILVLGVNGTGKTTTIARLCKLFKDHKISTIVAASDTFRAGAIEQLSIHMENVGIRVVKGQYNSDPASVGYDAIDSAMAKGIDVVIIDTAGRQITNKNLMEELKKIKRVNNPDLTLFVGDSLAGNDVLNQAEAFNSSLGIDASIITKVDADAKGGAALSIAHITKRPILYIGIGQGYDDLKPFDPEWFVEKLLG
ncbi:MAG: signal recognition particle-docking protein FtsY [Candidatus Lokiarchaeota archaeon]|nr:signal recognition particle-docking protein FtsY [Candidatus Lokiarchaeota archaeon]